jgi:hypothetical protein
MTGNGHGAASPRMRPAIRVVHATLLTTITQMTSAVARPRPGSGMQPGGLAALGRLRARQMSLTVLAVATPASKKGRTRMKPTTLLRRALGGSVAAAAAAFAVVAVAPAASAHTGTATITCSSVTFDSYTSFGSGSQAVLETVSIDGSQVALTTFTFTGPSGGPSTLAISVPADGQSHTVTADAFSVNENAEVIGFPVSQTLTCGTPCPPGTKANFRWHYSANGSSGSWSGTKSTVCPNSLTMGPQAMEGDLKVSPGTTLEAGYDFTVPGNHASFPLTVNNPQVIFAVRCVSGATPSAATFTVTMPTQTYSVTNDQWYPSGDQHSPLVYQGSITVPDLCGGGQLRLNQGGTFTATVG